MLCESGEWPGGASESSESIRSLVRRYTRGERSVYAHARIGRSVNRPIGSVPRVVERRSDTVRTGALPRVGQCISVVPCIAKTGLDPRPSRSTRLPSRRRVERDGRGSKPVFATEREGARRFRSHREQDWAMRFRNHRRGHDGGGSENGRDVYVTTGSETQLVSPVFGAIRDSSRGPCRSGGTLRAAPHCAFTGTSYTPPNPRILAGST